MPEQLDQQIPALIKQAEQLAVDGIDSLIKARRLMREFWGAVKPDILTIENAKINRLKGTEKRESGAALDAKLKDIEAIIKEYKGLWFNGVELLNRNVKMLHVIENLTEKTEDAPETLEDLQARVIELVGKGAFSQ